MTKSINSAVGLTKILISLPPTRILLLSIFILGILFGVLTNLSTYSGVNLLLRGSFEGLYLLSIPALLSALTIKLMIRRIEFKKIVATTLVGEIIYALTYFLSLFISNYNLEYSQFAVFIGSAFAFVLWYYIARLVFGVKWKGFLFAIVQSLFHILFLSSSAILSFETGPEDILFKFYVSIFILLAALYLFFTIINAPMKKTFGYTSLDAISMFLAQWLYEKKDIEKAFEQVGEKARTILSMQVFERKKDRLFFVTPYVHYGPFGNLGGSDFSYSIARELKKRHGANAFLFHGTVTHDLNPSSSGEIEEILDACDKCLKNCKPADAKISLRKGIFNECSAEVLTFGDSSLVGLSRAPEVTEDINFGLGLSLISKSEQFVNDAMVVDMHNADTGEITSFEPGTQEGYNYLMAVENAFSQKEEKSQLNLGVNIRSVSSECIGKGGIKIAIFSSSPEYVLVLIDSNGITPGFNEKIVKEIKKLGKQYKRNWEVGIFTTDTHRVNAVQGVSNPLEEDETVFNEIKTGVLEAMYDIQPAKFYSAKRWFDIDVLGPRQSLEIVSTINSIVAVSKIIAPLIIFAAVVMIIWILSKM